jgi:hypothetical protein
VVDDRGRGGQARHITLTGPSNAAAQVLVLVVVRGWALTVVVVNGFGAVERDDAGGRGCLRVAEDQHVGGSLPGLFDGAGDRDPAG